MSLPDHKGIQRGRLGTLISFSVFVEKLYGWILTKFTHQATCVENSLFKEAEVKTVLPTRFQTYRNIQNGSENGLGPQSRWSLIKYCGPCTPDHIELPAG